MSALHLEKGQSFPPEHILTIYRIFRQVYFVKPRPISINQVDSFLGYFENPRLGRLNKKSLKKF
jgi:hypothetical protein